MGHPARRGGKNLATDGLIFVSVCRHSLTIEGKQGGLVKAIGLIIGGGLLALSAHAAVTAEDIRYADGDFEMVGYLAYDDAVAGKRPGVIVVHEWWGHNDYARKRARMLAELGYTALAIDLYGDGKTASHPKDAGTFAGQALSDMAAAQRRFEAGMAVLKQHAATDPARVAAIGYCFGGGVVLNMARLGVELAAVASFHGSLKSAVPAPVDTVTPRVLVLHGAEDPMVPSEQVSAFVVEMMAADADLTLMSLPGVTHAFTNPEADVFAAKFNLPLAYDADADARTWSVLQDFLAATFAN